ncbi:hypothetical protein N1851_021911 [Merluccius polli]|uniref:Transposase n=1 Tax=Merluccius polli TaxID=89951 RepID=A0AA47MJ87_MERPO|nr:hypothetical protein N1851_021911 [Merluccius polli]
MGRHTYDAIATELEDIISQYGLTNNKVTACVTDNGSNFVKAFKEYQQQVNIESDEEEEVEDDGEVSFTDLNIASECLEEVSDKKLIVPTVTWWNSFHDAYARIIEMPLANIKNLCTQLQIKCMNDREYQFLKEYCSIMKPFTVALDILQGEDTCFYGKLQPTLEVLMAKTLAVKHGLSQMTAGLPDIIDVLLAAVSLPKFKLRWVREEARRDHIKLLLTTERACSPDARSSTRSCSSEDDFFSFDIQPDATTDSNAPISVEIEVMDYLKSAPTMESLHQFPRIKKIALRYNAPTPSSETVL